jgi:hypothetical protein
LESHRCLKRALQRLVGNQSVYLWSNHAWLLYFEQKVLRGVGTSLEPLAFAEPHCICRFRRSALTEPAYSLVLVPPLRTRRAVFPQRAPQSSSRRLPSDRVMDGDGFG